MLHNMALLVALDWEDPLIPAVVVVEGDGPFKGGMKAFETILKDVVEADQHRWVKVARSKAFHQFDKIKGATAIAARLNHDVSTTVNREIRLTPTIKSVQLCTAGHGPGPICFGQNHEPSTNKMTGI